MQAQVTAGVGTVSYIQAAVALANQLVQSAQAYAASVLARRVGILNGVLNPQILLSMGSNIRVETIAAAWTEVATANQFVDRVKALSQEVAALRATDASGNPTMGLIANIPFSTLTGWVAALIQAATDFETLELTTLPA